MSNTPDQLGICGLPMGEAIALPDPEKDMPVGKEGGTHVDVVLAGGCFWGIQALFQHVKGITGTVAGYAGEQKATAIYDLVSTGTTGHAEAVKLTYDPALITLGQILKVFFSVAHNPTELDRQGPDQGTQYRSAIFFATPGQKQIAEGYIDQLNKAHMFKNPIVTKVEPLRDFFPAEDYHQNYAALHPTEPYIATYDMPKVRALKKLYPRLYV